MAFEKWVKGGRWEDIAQVRNRRNEVIGPEVQLLLLSPALGFPVPLFPSLQSGNNDIAQNLHLKKIIKMIRPCL